MVHDAKQKMIKNVPRLLMMCLLLPAIIKAQSIGEFLPSKIITTERYLFYQHGAVITELGNNAINQSVPEWGPYEFLNILDSLKKQGFNVISEIRKKGVPNSWYRDKISGQIDSLLRAGVPARNIIVLGASAGWEISLQVSAACKNQSLHFVVMGGCWPETYKDFINLELYGRFLSITEASDPHGTCSDIFRKRKHVTYFREIKLKTGRSHGFIYKGYREWIDPVVYWIKSGT